MLITYERRTDLTVYLYKLQYYSNWWLGCYGHPTVRALQIKDSRWALRSRSRFPNLTEKLIMHSTSRQQQQTKEPVDHLLLHSSVIAFLDYNFSSDIFRFVFVWVERLNVNPLLPSPGCTKNIIACPELVILESQIIFSITMSAPSRFVWTFSHTSGQHGVTRYSWKLVIAII